MHTSAVWFTLPQRYLGRFGRDALQGGMLGIANLLRIAAPFYLMCDIRDIAVNYQVKCPFTDAPTIILYDNCPGGIGLAEKAFTLREMILRHCLTILRDCDCEEGCPSCVGPVSTIGPEGKKAAEELLGLLISELNGEENDAQS